MKLESFPVDEILLVLSVRPALEELIVDWLLAIPGGRDFNRVQVEEHSAQHEHLTAAEQVAGRQSRLQFQLRLRAGELEALLASVQEQFGGADIHYWVLPLLASGHMTETGDSE